MGLLQFTILVVILVVMPQQVNAENLVVPNFTTEHPIISYLHKQLALAMEATEQQYGKRRIVEVKVPTEEERQLRNLKLNLADIAWATCTAERNIHYRAVPVPQVAGLFGLRLNVIRHNDRRFTPVKDINALRQFIGVQSTKWLDYTIMLENGLNVLPTDRYSAYRAIEKGIADYYPRGVGEITGEMQESNVEGLTIEPSIALKYPLLFIIYVRKDNQQLAERLIKGFQTTIDNGVFMKLMKQQPWFEQAQNLLQNRTFIELENHYSDHLCAGAYDQYKTVIYQPQG